MTIIFILILLFSIVLHEYAHGWAAYKLGDYTPKLSGRLTLNPLAHIDPFGTVILPFFLLIATQGRFSIGYAKPVPINPYNFKNPRRDMIWVGLAGPLMNFILAILLSLTAKLIANYQINQIINNAAFLNIILAVFNLLPIPPLDGSRIVAGLLPYQAAYQYNKLEPLGFIIVIVLLLSGLFNWLILPLSFLIARLIGVNISFLL